MTKKIVSLIFFIFIAFTISAQVTFDANKRTQELKSYYSLDEKQSAEIQNIHDRKARNLSEIAQLRSTMTDEIYLKKLKSIRYHEDASIKKVLKDEQLTLFYNKKTQERKQRADLMNELKQKGKSPNEIEREFLEMSM